MRKGGWLPPHGERQFNLLRHMSREDQAPLGQRWEQLDKKKYLEEVMAGKSPHFKWTTPMSPPPLHTHT